MKFTKDWFIAAAERAIRTMAQVALTCITVGKVVSDIDWGNLVSMMLVSGIYSLLTSIVTTLPEVQTDGTLYIDDSGDTTRMMFAADTDPYAWAAKSGIRLKVNTTGYPKTEAPVVDLDDLSKD